LKVGESPAGAQGWQLSSISPRGAVFDGPEGQRTLELRVFDGTGGEAPTAMASPPPAGQATPARPTAGQSPARPASPRAAAADAAGDAGRTVPAPQPGQPVPTEGAPRPSPPAPTPDTPPARTPDEQVEAIRARIEARRARLR